jgi:hypothetical protein
MRAVLEADKIGIDLLDTNPEAAEAAEDSVG